MNWAHGKELKRREKSDLEQSRIAASEHTTNVCAVTLAYNAVSRIVVVKKVFSTKNWSVEPKHNLRVVRLWSRTDPFSLYCKADFLFTLIN